MSTFTLCLSGGRAGEAWEPSDKLTFFLSPKIKCISYETSHFDGGDDDAVLLGFGAV
jgi:hypothetical protein